MDECFDTNQALDKVSQCGIDPGNSSLEIRDRPFTPGSCPLIVGQAEERGRAVMQRNGNLRPVSGPTNYFSGGLVVVENSFIANEIRTEA